MSADDLQGQLFYHLKTKLGAEISLVDEVAQTLRISTDSAYRRIRGSKALSLEELHLLCNRHGLSVDALLQLRNGVVAFEMHSFNFKEHLVTMSSQMKYMTSLPQAELYCSCKNVPLFYHYHSNALAAFQYFFWHKTMFGAPGFGAQKFHLSDYPNYVFALGKEALQAYNRLNVHEVWNSETMNGTLRQLEFCHDTAAFHKKEDLSQVYEGMEDLLLHLEQQAEVGYQFAYGDKEQTRLGDFHLHVNEVVMGDNSMLALVGNTKLAFLLHSGINLMLTRNADFCENLYGYYQSLLRTSSLISKVGERERAGFFHGLRKRIAAHKKSLRL